MRLFPHLCVTALALGSLMASANAKAAGVAAPLEGKAVAVVSPSQLDSQFQGTLESGITLAGTIGLSFQAGDPLSYGIDFLDLTAAFPKGGTEHFDLSGHSETSSLLGDGYPEQLLFVASYADGSDMTDGDLLALYLPLQSFLSAGGGPVCSLATPCTTGESRYSPNGDSPYAGPERLLESGRLCGDGSCPSAVTPEPSSLALLATGLLGLAGLLSRIRRAQTEG